MRTVTAVLAASGLFLLSTSATAAAPSPSWGYLANPGFVGDPVKAIYFFPGEGKCSNDGVSPIGVGVSVVCNPYA